MFPSVVWKGADIAELEVHVAGAAEMTIEVRLGDGFPRQAPRLAVRPSRGGRALAHAALADGTGAVAAAALPGLLRWGVGSLLGAVVAELIQLLARAPPVLLQSTAAVDSTGLGRLPPLAVPAMLPELAGMDAERAVDLLSSSMEYQVWYAQLDCVVRLKAARESARDALESLAESNLALLRDLENERAAYERAKAAVAEETARLSDAQRRQQDRLYRLSLPYFALQLRERAQARESEAEAAVAAWSEGAKPFPAFLAQYRELRRDFHKDQALLAKLPAEGST